MPVEAVFVEGTESRGLESRGTISTSALGMVGTRELIWWGYETVSIFVDLLSPCNILHHFKDTVTRQLKHIRLMNAKSGDIAACAIYQV